MTKYLHILFIAAMLPALVWAAPARTAKKKSSRKPTMTYEQRYEAYLKQKAEVEKYNQHVARYTSRDISHRLGFYGQVGYSSFFTQGLQYNADANLGFDGIAKGGVGGGLGLSYQLRYQCLLFTTGLEGQVYTSKTVLNASGNPLERTYVMSPYSATMSYHYTYHELSDSWKGAFLQLPLLLGMEFAGHRAFFLAGTKIGMGIYGDSRVRSDYSTWSSDVELVGSFFDMPNHCLFSHQTIDQTMPLKWNLNMALYGEIGMSLDRWLQPADKQRNSSRGKQQTLPWHVRLSVFAEYGVLNVRNGQTVNTVESDMPVYVTPPTEPMNLQVASALATTTAHAAAVHPFMAGVKLAVYYDFPRRKLKPMRLPREPKKPVKKDEPVVEPVVEEPVVETSAPVYQQQEVKKGMTIKIDHLFFATNKTTILPESNAAMQELATFLLDFPDVSILIIGHTDNVGSEESNKRLSEGRAREVRNQLIVRGVNPDQLQYEGRGESQPVADNDTEEGRAQNRRVEIVILDTQGQQIEQLF